jgi:hypothetical protein
MISPAGTVWGVARASYIYAIVNGATLYIGETGDLPPKRWGQHLQAGGTYIGKASAAGVSITGPDDVLFLAVRCRDLDLESPPYRKLARRAVEEEVHRQFLLDNRALGDEFQLLSLAPSPPIRYNWAFNVVEVAKEIHAHFITEWVSWSAAAQDAQNSRR